MTETIAPATSAPIEQGWGRLLVALALVLFVPAFGPFRFLVPIEQTMLIIIPVMAAMMVVAWSRGGSLVQAAFWALLALWTVARPSQGAFASAPGFAGLAAGWGLVLGAIFATLAIVRPQWSFFPRAIVAIAAAGALGAVGVIALQRTDQLSAIATEEFGRRGDELHTQLQVFVTALEKDAQGPESQQAIETFKQMETILTPLPGVAVIVGPALLALESLAILALCWAFFHRRTLVRLGPPLADLRDFRFSDFYVWGLIVGIILALIPGLADGRGVEVNLLVFFGLLYAVRGIGVAVHFLSPGPFLSAIAVIGALIAWPVAVSFAFGLGLGDTWIDWRRRAPRPTP